MSLLAAISLFNSARVVFRLCVVAIAILLPVGCRPIDSKEAEIEPREAKRQPIAVDVAIARQEALEQQTEYTGTTLPNREISVRSQVEGQLLDILVDVGDAVQQGQLVAEIDNNLQIAEVTEAEAELAALQSEVVSLQAEVNDARVEVERSRLELQQAKSDAARSEQLYRQGAISQQNVELARTAVGTANQTLLSAQQQVQNRISAVDAAKRRLNAQQALISQARQRQSYTSLTAAVNGFVLQRFVEPGDLVQPGDEVLRLGDLSQVKVEVQISELALGSIKLGQSAQVRLDAFGDRIFAGKVSQISPIADPAARLVPLEVTFANQANQRIGSGLLARVSLASTTQQQVVIPETATQIADSPNNKSHQNQTDQQSATIFVVNDSQTSQTTVRQTEVVIGKKADGRQEILSGLEPGEQYVVRSSQKLTDGAKVRLSFISETHK